MSPANDQRQAVTARRMAIQHHMLNRIAQLPHIAEPISGAAPPLHHCLPALRHIHLLGQQTWNN